MAGTGLVLIKRFSYRGDSNEEWSNKYWLSGDPPSSPADWRTLFDALVAEERGLYGAGTEIIGGYGYDSDADNAVAAWSVDLTVSPNAPVAGNITWTNVNSIPGDCAAWIRWGLDRLNSKGKRVYLRKYFHIGANDHDAIDQTPPAWRTAALAFGAKLSDGSFAGGRTIVDRKHQGAAVLNHGCSTYVTTRTLKRRGKRP